LVMEFTFPLSRHVCCSFRCSSAIPRPGYSYGSTTLVSWAWSNFLCLLHSIHSFLVAGLRHSSYSHVVMLALCSQDGIGFMESFFMNLLKVFHYVVIVMLDWNLPHEGLRSLKFVAHITMPRNSVLILFGSKVESLWVPSAMEQPH
jgi:hypothetical protein